MHTGLEDLYLAAYNRMAQGEPWGRMLLRGLASDDEHHEVR